MLNGRVGELLNGNCQEHCPTHKGVVQAVKLVAGEVTAMKSLAEETKSGVYEVRDMVKELRIDLDRHIDYAKQEERHEAEMEKLRDKMETKKFPWQTVMVKIITWSIISVIGLVALLVFLFVLMNASEILEAMF